MVGLFASNIGEYEISQLFGGEEKWVCRMNRLRVGGKFGK